MEGYNGQENGNSRSGIGLNGGNLATFGCGWRESVPAIVETNIYGID
jgi:hypothetical protein